MNEKEKLIKIAFDIDFLEWYVKAFDLPKKDIKRIGGMKEKPRAYRELLLFLDPFAKKLLRN